MTFRSQRFINTMTGETVTQVPLSQIADYEQLGKLPHDTDGLNDDRANRANVALLAYKNQPAPYFDKSNAALADLLSDLKHWADRHGLDFDNELCRGLYHYDAETTKEGGL